MKDTKDTKKCDVMSGCWTHRSQVLGAVFLVIAAILTLLTLNGFGILGMFLVGIMLCRRKSMESCCGCSCHSMMDDKCTSTEHKDTPVKKKTVKKSA